MKGQGRRIGWITIGLILLCSTPGPASDHATLGAAFKQIDKSVKGIGGVVAEVEYSEIIDKRPAFGKGKLYANMGGLMRAEIGGDTPRTILIYPPYLYVHRVNDQEVDVYDMFKNPGRLSQYVMLGFAPAGSAMKKRFNVEFVQRSTLEGRPVPSFLLTPKSKQAASAIARIQLWVDPESGLPLRHEVAHAAGRIQLTVHYVSMTRDDDLPVSLFQPKWPDGTRTVLRD